MIDEGETAPEFSLPAVVDGEVEEVALDDYLGDDIIILAFYPADFNPACSGETTDLDELDLFTMQKDVSIVGISADSVYSHRAFADEYDLHIPLLADVHGAVAADYGVVADSGAGHLVNRAVVVIDPGGEVQYTWQTENMRELPPVKAVREAVEDVGGSSTAKARYRVAHAHYVEGRRAFTKAMGEFEEMEWMMAQADFTRAQGEFEEAADQFNTAVRFGEDETSLKYFERAEEKAKALWQAAEWLADSASAYASGEGADGESMRKDAEAPLEEARDIHEPPSPDDFPPEVDPAERDDRGEESILPTEEEGPPASLEGDLEPDAPEAAELASEIDDGVDDIGGESAGETSVETVADGANASGHGDDEDEEEIDDEELEEIAAELEAQTEQAKAKQAAEDDDSAEESVVSDDPTAVADEEDAEADGTGVTGDPDESPANGPGAGDGETTAASDEPASETETTDDASAGIEVEAGSVDAPGEGTGASDAGETDSASDTAGDEEAPEPDAEDVEGELDEGDIELDLADPTEGTDAEPDEPAEFDDEDEEEDEDDNLGSGDHGVPDSL